MGWVPNIRKNSTYILKIPDKTSKHRETRALLNGRRVKVLSKIDNHRGHGVYRVKLLDTNDFPSKFPKEFKMFGPYLCCNCPEPISAGCKCGGY